MINSRGRFPLESSPLITSNSVGGLGNFGLIDGTLTGDLSSSPVK